MALHHQINLPCNRIDRIHHVIIRHNEKRICLIRQIKRLHRIHDRIRIDIQNTLFHRFRFQLPYRPGSRMNLAVDIGQAYPVVIDQNQMTDACSSEPFRHKRPDAADTENSDRAPGQLLHAAFSQKQFCPGKSA